MTLIALQNPIVDIRGSIGGTVYKRDASGLHCNAVARVNRKRSPLQDRRRRAFRTATNAWAQVLQAGNHNLWNAYASRHPGQNRIGETIIYTGYQMFMRFNIYRAYNNVSLILLPPEG